MKYVEKRYSLRVHRRNGTSKLLLGVTGRPPKIGSIMEIRVAHEVLKVKLMEYSPLPRTGRGDRGAMSQRTS
jgi:hypothetical protein